MCIPWRGGEPSREEAWRRVSEHLVSYGLPVYTGDSDPDKPFNRSQARNRAAAAVPEADILVFLDADHVVPVHQVRKALDVAERWGWSSYPYDRVMVENLLTNRRHVGSFDRKHVTGNIVVPRAVYEAVGGWDERFLTWGWEDGAFSRLVSFLSRPVERIRGDALVYDHARAPDERPEAIGDPPPLVGRYVEVRGVAAARLMAAEVRAARQ